MSSNQPAPHRDLADEGLVASFQATGEMIYFEELWRRHFQSVYSKSLSFLRNHAAAEDVTAEVFLRALAGLLDRYQPGHFAGWLHTIAKHQCINHVQRAAERLHGGSTHHRDIVSTCDPGGASEVESILQLLTVPQRIAIKLFYANGYSYDEIAKLEGWSTNQVKAHIQSGRRRFRMLWDRSAQGKER